MGGRLAAASGVLAPWPVTVEGEGEAEQEQGSGWSIGQGGCGKCPSLGSGDGGGIYLLSGGTGAVMTEECSHGARVLDPSQLGWLPGCRGGMWCSAGTGLTRSRPRVEVSPGITGFEPCPGQGASPRILAGLTALLRAAAPFGPRCRCFFQNFFPKPLKYLGPGFSLGPVLN